MKNLERLPSVDLRKLFSISQTACQHIPYLLRENHY